MPAQIETCHHCLNGTIEVAMLHQKTKDTWNVYSFPCKCTHEVGYHLFSLIPTKLYTNREPIRTVKHLSPKVYIHPSSAWVKWTAVKKALAKVQAKSNLADDLPF